MKKLIKHVLLKLYEKLHTLNRVSNSYNLSEKSSICHNSIITNSQLNGSIIIGENVKIQSARIIG